MRFDDPDTGYRSIVRPSTSQVRSVGLSLLLVLSTMAVGIGLGAGPVAAASDSVATAEDTDRFDFGLELEQRETVVEGGDAEITTYPYNRADQPVSGTTVELRVDTNDDGQFDSTEVVATRSADFDANEYKTIDLTYSNVQLSPGNYSYMAQISKDGKTNRSFTNGTLVVKPERFDFGVELEQRETVVQGGNATVSAYPYNRADQPVSGTTVELLVDENNDGQFASSEVVASTNADFAADEFREINLTYSNVQLSPGNYSYMARISKDGQTTRSFTNGTLVVKPERFDFGIELEQVETVNQNGDANVTAFPNNRANQPVTGTTVELLVDTNDDDQFASSEVVASTNADFAANEYRTIYLVYTNVQLSPGNYSYIARVSKDGLTNRSFTNGTLVVGNGSSGALPTAPGEPSFQDVLGVIEAFNDGQQYNGANVSFQDVLAVIEAFNDGS